MDDFNVQKQYWNGVADSKEFTTPFNNKLFDKYIPKTAKILDIGCGYGRTLSALYENGYKNLLGLDISDEMITAGKKRFPFLDLRVKPNENIDLPDESVDAVLLFAVLTCIADNETQNNLLSEIYRVLRKNGILCINDFLLNNDERNLQRYNKAAELQKFPYGVFEVSEGVFLRHHDKEYITELTKSFKSVYFYQDVYNTMNGHKSNGFMYFGQKV